MPNSGNPLVDDVNIGALQQRVHGLEGAQRALSENVSHLATRVETLFAGLSSKIEERSRPQYNLLISLGVFGLAVILAVGGLAYAPIRENQSDLKAAASEASKAIAALANQTAFQVNQLSKEMGRDYVSVRELDQRSTRTRAEIDRLNLDINGVQAALVPRGELLERWRAGDQQDQSLQRQIDELKRFNTDLVSAKDFIKNMDDRVRLLERRPPS